MPYMMKAPTTRPYTRASEWLLEGVDPKDYETLADLSGVNKIGSRRLEPHTEVPKIITISKRGPMRDLFGVSGAMTVISPAFKGLLEEYDSGEHQIIPVELRWKNGDLVPGEFFVLHVTAFKDSVDWDRTPHTGKGKVRRPRSYGDNPLVFYPYAKEPPHLWREAQHIYDLFISNELYKQIKARKLKTFMIHPK